VAVHSVSRELVSARISLFGANLQGKSPLDAPLTASRPPEPLIFSSVASHVIQSEAGKCVAWNRDWARPTSQVSTRTAKDCIWPSAECPISGEKALKLRRYALLWTASVRRIPGYQQQL